MSKSTEARVRDELLQTLYTHVLRCTLAAAAAGVRAEDAATSAGVIANLQDDDIVLLPARRGVGLRTLCGLAPVPARHKAHEHASRVYSLPRNEPQAVAFCLAMGLAAGVGQVVVVVLPPGVPLAVSHAKPRELPSTWTAAAAYAARAALPLLFLSVERSPAGPSSAAGAPADPSRPAPLYPSIPVDRDDALAVYRVAFECLSRARTGGGPSYIAAGRYPALPGPLLDSLSGDGLARLETMLRKRGRYSKAWQRSLEREITRELTGVELTGQR